MIATDLVTLAGSPTEVGAAYGRATADCTRRNLADFMANVEIEGVGMAEVRRRTDIYTRIVDRRNLSICLRHVARKITDAPPQTYSACRWSAWAD